MDEGREDQSDRQRSQRLVERAEAMVKSGRLTPEEAARLRTARGTGEVEEVVRDIRARHAGARLDAAVGEGDMSREEADGFLVQLRRGEHPRMLRGLLRYGGFGRPAGGRGLASPE